MVAWRLSVLLLLVVWGLRVLLLLLVVLVLLLLLLLLVVWELLVLVGRVVLLERLVERPVLLLLLVAKTRRGPGANTVDMGEVNVIAKNVEEEDAFSNKHPFQFINRSYGKS